MFTDSRRITIQPYFKWFDLWVGIYVDTTLDVLYIQLIPCFGVKLYVAGEKHIDRRKPEEKGEGEWPTYH